MIVLIIRRVILLWLLLCQEVRGSNDIRLSGTPIVSFSNASNAHEIIMNYTFPALLNASVTVLDSNCTTTGSNSITASYSENTPGALTVSLDVNETTIQSSEYYHQVSSVQADLYFCLRVQALNGSTVVNALETNTTVALDLTNQINTSSFGTINITRDNGVTLLDNANLDFPVHSYYCDDNGNQTDPPNVKGLVDHLLQFCVELATPVSGLAVERVWNLGIYQGNKVSMPIEDGYGSAVTSTWCSSGKCNIKTNIESRFFSSATDTFLNVSGQVLLTFTSRRLNVANSGLTNQYALVSFGFSLDVAVRDYFLAGSEQTTPPTFAIGMATILVVTFALIGGILYAKRRKKQPSLSNDRHVDECEIASACFRDQETCLTSQWNHIEANYP